MPAFSLIVNLKTNTRNMTLDENRGYLLEAGFPQTILPVLDAYTESATLGYPMQPLILSKLHLDIVKTMVGALLNCSLDYGRQFSYTFFGIFDYGHQSPFNKS